MKEIVLLGSTGSIGEQTLEVVRTHKMKIKALSANSNTQALERQAREFSPEYVCIADKSCYEDIKTRLADTEVKILCGLEGLCEAASLPCGEVVNSVVGMVGLEPTLAAIKAKNTIGLANKETLVVGGSLVIASAGENGMQILPIDSEHSAIFQSLMGNEQNKIEKIILTASGGPFFGYTAERLKTVTKEQALRHPNWSMGKKITIDSATMMNKGLELIEAVWLFGVSPEQVEITVHRQSVLHSAVEYADGSVIGQLGAPDMRIPIQLALTYPARFPCPAKKLSLMDIGTLTFEKPDENAFPCIKAAKRAIKEGGNMPCIMNSANETAVELFLQDKISFYEISGKVCEAMNCVSFSKALNLDIIKETERETREFVLSH